MATPPPPRWPPGFRFSPTDEELVLYFLKRRIAAARPTPYIADVDVYKSHPSHLPERSALRTGDKQWFFCSRLDRKYPNGSRASRTTADGYWKATGKDRAICNGGRAVGNKKTLVYHHGRAPRGQRTDWVMHEYTLLPDALPHAREPFALYKLFEKSGAGPKNGEQYGAPFREEDWLDDDDHDVVQLPLASADPIIPTATVPRSATVEDQIGDLEVLLLQNGDDPPTTDQTPSYISTPSSSQIPLQHGPSWPSDDGNAAEVADATTSGGGPMLAAENAELPLGDLEGLLMEISDNQRAANSFQEFSASVPQLQLQHDDHEPWRPNADMEEISVADYAASSGVADASGCAGTELPFGDLEGLLLQLDNDQENIEPPAEADFSAPVPHHGFHQAGVGDFQGCPGAVFSSVDPSSVLQESTNLGPQCEPSNHIAQSALTNMPLSWETNCTEETSALRSVSGLASYDSQDADDEFLEINDFFDLEDAGQGVNCTATEHLISASNGMYDSMEYADASMFLPGSFDTAGVGTENQNGYLGDNGSQNQAFHYTSESWTQNQVALNVRNSMQHNHVIFSSHASGTSNIHTMNEEPSNRNPQDSQSWFNTAVSTLLDAVPAGPALAAESNVLNRTLQRISSFRSEQASHEEPSAPVIQLRRRGAGLISVSLLVLLAAILWAFATGTGYAIKFCKGLWSSSST
ncbi:uncharacterized protein LOC124652256 [Lolium rigidum]|uniref:uncharacterized protein LOC124652256 n=1 Tax=Lolium rigidum TaxID=89674 RepID=UPI001F5C52BE|nr:uncharacterized protein LOC124652256 [Lolium rigidum]